MSDVTLKELDDQIALCRQRFTQVIDQIRIVLADDVPRFVAREAKRAFLARTEVAASLSDDQVSELKRRSEEEGARAGARIMGELADDDVWTRTSGEPDDSRSLVGADAVWQIVRAVEGDARALLADFGLEDADRPIYKAPSYFVKGLYLPTLVEHYWKLLHELDSLEDWKREVSETSTRNSLSERWEKA